jgi:hypothetical protein
LKLEPKALTIVPCSQTPSHINFSLRKLARVCQSKHVGENGNLPTTTAHALALLTQGKQADTQMEACPYIDDLVAEYLTFRGFVQTVQTFQQEERDDKLKGFQVIYPFNTTI